MSEHSAPGILGRHFISVVVSLDNAILEVVRDGCNVARSDFLFSFLSVSAPNSAGDFGIVVLAGCGMLSAANGGVVGVTTTYYSGRGA